MKVRNGAQSRFLPNQMVISPCLAFIFTRPFGPIESRRKMFNSSFLSGVIGDQIDRTYVFPCFS
jgi:hypothetical protein